MDKEWNLFTILFSEQMSWVTMIQFGQIVHSLNLPKKYEIGALNWVSFRIYAPYYTLLKLIMFVIGSTISYV